MKKLEIFEPAMCCATGLCGPSVDPELLRISTLLSALGEKGIAVGRYNLNSAPQAFASTVFFARPTAKRVQPRARSVVSSRPSKSSFAMVLYRTMGPAMHWWKSAA